MTRSVRIDELPQRICILSGMRHRWLNAPMGGRVEEDWKILKPSKCLSNRWS